MPDCTHILDRRPRRRRRPLIAAIAAALLVASWWPACALGDGDPASDVLASQPLFVPSDAGVAADQQARLSALLAAARRSGYAIRVALIASKADLGSVTALWRQPEDYARFLGQELSLVGQAPLLVVIPDGFGVAGGERTLTSGRSALRGIPISASNGGLAGAAVTALVHLAAAGGHQLPTPQAVGPTAAASTSATPWIAFAVGTVLILAAWTASLRARPLRRRA